LFLTVLTNCVKLFSTKISFDVVVSEQFEGDACHNCERQKLAQIAKKQLGKGLEL
jgi:hypothetical protein